MGFRALHKASQIGQAGLVIRSELGKFLRRGQLPQNRVQPDTVDAVLGQALEQGRVQPGANLLLTGFGAGLTWSAHVVRWGERVTPLGESEVALPACDRTALEIVEGYRAAKRGSGLVTRT